jgi:hypothetical protein
MALVPPETDDDCVMLFYACTDYQDPGKIFQYVISS